MGSTTFTRNRSDERGDESTSLSVPFQDRSQPLGPDPFNDQLGHKEALDGTQEGGRTRLVDTSLPASSSQHQAVRGRRGRHDYHEHHGPSNATNVGALLSNSRAAQARSSGGGFRTAASRDTRHGHPFSRKGWAGIAVNEPKAQDFFEGGEITELDPGSLSADPAPEQRKEGSNFADVASRFFRLVLLVLILVLVALLSALTAMRVAIHGREIEVPKLIGMTPLEAETVLSDRGLRLEVESRFYATDVPEGRVLSQSPAPQTAVRRGWRVRVAESLGAPRATVPNVIGQSSRAAEINVRRRGLEVGKMAVVHLPNLPSSQVVAMSPPPETIGSSPKVSLLLTTAEESEALLMPNLVGKRIPDAEKVLEQLGLYRVKGTANSVTSGDDRHQTVRRQVPAAGSKVNRGLGVVLESSH